MKLLKNYSKLITKFPFIIIIFSIIITIISINLASNVGIKDLKTEKMLPQNLELIKGIDILEDEFQTSKSLQIVIELNPSLNSKITDIREPEIIKYSYILAKEISYLEQVRKSSSAGTYLKSINNNHLPNSIQKVKELNKNNLKLKDYINNDYSISLIKFSLKKDYNAILLMNNIDKILNNVKKPNGIKVTLAGDNIAQKIVNRDLGPDMAKTSNISMIGIIILLLLIFKSIIYGILPLFTIIFGLIWAFGYMGLMSVSLSSASAGVISMIMGIGIDFGIQTIMRFKQELAKIANPALAMEKTLNNVIIPMATTTFAAIIGFQSMSLGNITFLKDMGDIMTYGVSFSFFAAITIVPAIIIIYEKYIPKLFFKKLIKLIKGEVKF